MPALKRERITSGQNPRIKELLRLAEKSRARRETGLFVVEGQRELGHCLDSAYVPQTIFVCESLSGAIFSENGSIEFKEGADVLISKALALNPDLNIIEVPDHLYEKLAYRGSTEGVVATVKAKTHGLKDLHLGTNPLVMVLEAVEKPGNLGAVLRSADAAGADAVIICDPLTDLYNPNLIRSSVGSVFGVQLAAASSEETISFLKSLNIKILTAQLQDSSLYYETDMSGAAAIVMGAEATGLSRQWRDAADAHIRIPMLGRMDSLNVSVSAAVLLYEAVRQRNK